MKICWWEAKQGVIKIGVVLVQRECVSWGGRCACISWEADLMWFGKLGCGLVAFCDGFAAFGGGLVEVWVFWGVSMDQIKSTSHVKICSMHYIQFVLYIGCPLKDVQCSAFQKFSALHQFSEQVKG